MWLLGIDDEKHLEYHWHCPVTEGCHTVPLLQRLNLFWLFPFKILLKTELITLVSVPHCSSVLTRAFPLLCFIYSLKASLLSSFLYGEGTQGRFLWSCCLPTSTAAFPAPAWLPLSAGVPPTRASVAMAASRVPQKVTPESCTIALMLSFLPSQAGMPLLLRAIYFSAFATRPSFRFHARRSLEMELTLRYFHYVQQ